MSRQQIDNLRAAIEGLFLLIAFVVALAVVGPTIDAPQYEVGHGLAREIGGRHGN
jgi:hypothetical protein